MSAPTSPPGSVRRHGRNISHPMVRRTTKGPLDAPIDDPLSEPPSSVASPAPFAKLEDPPRQSPIPEPALTQANVDLKFLQNSQIYHPLPTDDVHPAFLSSPQKPPLDTPLPDLIQAGHFRRAADAATRSLLRCDPADAETILHLLYTRLACLILISRPDIAVQEAIPLTETLARNLPAAKDLVPLIPWGLRLLLVRMQSIGAADGGRRGVMALYALAAEVRSNLKQAQADNEASEIQIWEARLQDLGLRVADALVEMGELETANRHLDTLTDNAADEIAYRKALLRIRVGDVSGAQQSLTRLQGARKTALTALLEAAEGDYSTAEETWRALAKEPESALAANNLAVSLLYTGHIDQARQTLENIIEISPSFAGALFNVATVYELCTERANGPKGELAQKLAAKRPSPESGGWEKVNFDFKL
ncbi:regulation of kinetochore assembly [Teratosphaeria destructans]|uniref:Regulation of kinetochore assembly n=1 Tax=Teratosphaeria destructans TaxID=418781 RepID=A0A9W7SPW9_9PEZI|nr:regulation of kinetochore assembly [Teratosphaeria destructans]